MVLGSLRVRQDILIFQALVGANITGTGDPSDPITAALARIRQLSAHEVGHALGFNHNFASSTQERGSVMDYPPPRIGFDGNRIDLSQAYSVGLGPWDRFLVDYVYGARTDAEARAKVAAARAAGLRFVADADARPLGSGHPEAAMWDDGSDPVAELGRVMAIRRVALDRFGHNSVPAGRADGASCAAPSCRSGCSTATRSRPRPSRWAGSSSPSRSPARRRSRERRRRRSSGPHCRLCSRR